ncbi:MAG: hypothetical protein IMZ62_07445 [Chloroflexi bacterium]|nr:hypothetical protein [Chloroflexota bacterium]
MSVLGFDSSQWQDAPETPVFIDANKAVAAGAKFAIPRASYGLVPDRIFPRAFDGYRAAGLITGAFQFADYRTYAKYNVQKFIQHLEGRVPDVNALDLENNDTYWPGMWPGNGANLTAWVWDWLIEYKAQAFTQKALLYINTGALKQMRANLPLLERIAAEMPLWLAWWDPGEPPAEKYWPWTRYTILQPRPSAVGKKFGMESGNLDLDYYPESLDELKAFVGKIPAPQPELSDIEKLRRLWAAHPELH